MSDIVRSSVGVNARAAANSALDLLNQALLYIDDARKRCVESGDIAGLMIGLENISKISLQLATVTNSVKMDLLTNVATWQPVPSGTGWVGPSDTTNDTWDSEGVLDAVISFGFAEAMNLTEGEIDVTTIVGCIRGAVFACAPVTPSMGWRTTELKARGIDPEVYRERTKRTTIKWDEEPPAPLRARLAREFPNQGER